MCTHRVTHSTVEQCGWSCIITKRRSWMSIWMRWQICFLLYVHHIVSCLTVPLLRQSTHVIAAHATARYNARDFETAQSLFKVRTHIWLADRMKFRICYQWTSFDWTTWILTATFFMSR